MHTVTRKVFQMQVFLLILPVVTNMLLCCYVRYQGQAAIVCSHC